MLETYSEEIEVRSGEAIPFDVNVDPDFSGTVEHEPGSCEIFLRKPGVYLVTCTASCSPLSTGLMGMQMSLDGEMKESACAGMDAIEGDPMTSMSFSTIVRVDRHWRPYGPKPSSAFRIVNLDTATMYNSVTLAVVRVNRGYFNF